MALSDLLRLVAQNLATVVESVGVPSSPSA
jgi:hypothetical protein